MEWKRIAWFASSLTAAELLVVGVISGTSVLAGEGDSMGSFLVLQVPILVVIPLYFARRIHRMHFLHGFSAGVLSAGLLVIVISSIYGVASLLSWFSDSVDATIVVAVLTAFLVVYSLPFGVLIGLITWGINKKCDGALPAPTGE